MEIINILKIYLKKMRYYSFDERIKYRTTKYEKIKDDLKDNKNEKIIFLSYGTQRNPLSYDKNKNFKEKNEQIKNFIIKENKEQKNDYSKIKENQIKKRNNNINYNNRIIKNYILSKQ